MNARTLAALLLLLLTGCATSGTTPGTESAPPPPADDQGTYDPVTLVDEAEAFFGAGAAGLADVLNKIFSDKGRPNAFIKGEEGGAAFGLGLRYGQGTLQMTNGANVPVYWRGPSIGLDVGGNAAKVFILVYDLPDTASLYQRFPGVEGSLYFVGGVGANYNSAGNIQIAPVRFGVGWRQGVNLGYMHFSPDRNWIPF